jgi:hypothetical protein
MTEPREQTTPQYMHDVESDTNPTIFKDGIIVKAARQFLRLNAIDQAAHHHYM